MTSQFEKRKAKSAAEVAKEITDRRDNAEANMPVYTQSAYDVYTPDGGKTYEVAEISYNPESGEAKVVNTFSITRLIALNYATQKQALGILKKQRKEK